MITQVNRKYSLHNSLVNGGLIYPFFQPSIYKGNIRFDDTQNLNASYKHILNFTSLVLEAFMRIDQCTHNEILKFIQSQELEQYELSKSLETWLKNTQFSIDTQYQQPINEKQQTDFERKIREVMNQNLSLEETNKRIDILVMEQLDEQPVLHKGRQVKQINLKVPITQDPSIPDVLNYKIQYQFHVTHKTDRMTYGQSYFKQNFTLYMRLNLNDLAKSTFNIYFPLDADTRLGMMTHEMVQKDLAHSDGVLNLKRVQSLIDPIIKEGVRITQVKSSVENKQITEIEFEML